MKIDLKRLSDDTLFIKRENLVGGYEASNEEFIQAYKFDEEGYLDVELDQIISYEDILSIADFIISKKVSE